MSASERPTSVDSAELDLGQWQHLHPLSPLLRGGVVVLAMIGYAVSHFVRQAYDALTGSDDGDEGGGSRGGPDLGLVADHLLLAAGIGVFILAVLAGLSWMSWWHTKFRVHQGQVELRRGWVFREHRQVPFERVQAVEINRPLLAQLTGLSKVIVQSAGGSDSKLNLDFLPKARADEVRRELLLLAGRHDEGRVVRPDGPARPVPDGSEAAAQVVGQGEHTAYANTLDEGREIVRVPNGRLFVATILHGGTIVLGVLGLIAGGIAAVSFGSRVEALNGAVFALPALVPFVVGFGVNRVGELLKYGNFRLSASPQSARVSRGLTDLRHTTIPLHRVQAVKLRQPLWWRKLGWWRVEVNVAGMGSVLSEESSKADTTVLPVGTLDQALEIVTLLDPVLSADDLRTAALGSGESGGWTLVSPRARIFDWWSWKRAGFKVSPHSLMVRSGALTRQVAAMPHARVQSLTLDQGPWDRRRRLAGLTLISTPGPVKVTVDHLDGQVAEALRADEARRARDARATSSTPVSELDPSAPSSAAPLDNASTPNGGCFDVSDRIER